MSLAAGVATLRALRHFSVPGLALKWPNDVLRDGGKLGGILSELRVEAKGPAYVVVGAGINVRLAAEVRDAITRAGGVPPADLAGLQVPKRTLLAAALVDAFVAALVAFEAQGFAPFREEWRAADALRDRPVRVQLGDQGYDAVARGVADDGALQVDVRIQMLTAGEVTLRAVA